MATVRKVTSAEGGSRAKEQNATSSYQDLPLTQISASAYQARKDFDGDALSELANSMREQGLLEPVVVREISNFELRNANLRAGKQPSAARSKISALPSKANSQFEIRNSKSPFELISGERRLRAAKLLGWKTIPAIVLEGVSDADAAVKGLIENLQRENLNPIEEAEGFAALQRLDKKRWTLLAVGKSIGKDKGYVSRSLSLLVLPEPIQEKLRRRNFSRGHGIELSRLGTAALQLKVASQIKDSMTVHETRRLIDQILNTPTTTDASASTPPLPIAPSAIDPLLSLWSALRAQIKLAPGEDWSVFYPRQGVWQFTVKTDPSTAVRVLREWAAELEQGLQSAEAKALGAAPQIAETQQELLAQMFNAAAKGGEGFDPAEKARLPKNADDWGELDAATIKGPSAVYRWIFGPESRFAKALEGKDWSAVGPGDAVTMVHDLVKRLRK